MSLRPRWPDLDVPEDEPFVDIAMILASGVLRLRQRDRRSEAISPESGVHGLALVDESRPAVVDGSESHRKDERCH